MQAGQSPGYDDEVSIYSHCPVDISTTAFSYSHAVQYHKLLNGMGVNACVLLHGRVLGLFDIVATIMCLIRIYAVNGSLCEKRQHCGGNDISLHSLAYITSNVAR